MKYAKFESIILHMIKHSKKMQEAYDLKIDLDYVVSYQTLAVELLWEEVLTKEGVEWLWWYLYEKNGISGKPRKELKAWDDKKKEICKNIKSLWKYLTKSKHFKTLNHDNMDNETLR